LPVTDFRQFRTKFFQPKTLVVSLGVFLWAGAIIAGFSYLNTYQSTPGKSQVALSDWPAQSELALDSKSGASGNFRALMFVHPQCPCSSASLSELGVLLARAPQLQAHVVFTHPDGASNSWISDSTLYKKAKSIPGLKVLVDKNGKEAKLFGVETSGHLCVFDPQNRLVFDGGVTGRRGHEGDNAGLDSVVRLVHGRESALKKTNVFGCAFN
jgi:hypothetical protein